MMQTKNKNNYKTKNNIIYEYRYNKTINRKYYH